MEEPGEVCGIFQSEILIDPLKFQPNSSAINTLLNILKMSIGPNGKLKIIQNFAGSHVTVTSSSSRLFHIVPVKNFIIKFIISSVNTQLNRFGNGGLYCALLTLYLLENSIKCDLNPIAISKIYQYLGMLFNKALNSSLEECVAKIDVSKLCHLHKVVKCIISSKPACTLTEKGKEDLILLLIKSFINSIPEISQDNPVIYRHSIAFHLHQGLALTSSKLLCGILLKNIENYKKSLISNLVNICQSSNKPFKVALFSACLSGNENYQSDKVEEHGVCVREEVLQHLKQLAIKLICDGAEIVFCQKGIHFDIKQQLEDNDVLVVERLGTEISSNLQLMTGAVPVLCIADVKSITYGFITSFEIVDVTHEKHILVQNEDRPFQTIMLCNSNEEALEETKVVCKQALDTLFRLVKDPRVCCGGGCTDMCLSNFLRKMVTNEAEQIAMKTECSVTEVLQVLNTFISSIQSVALSLYDKPRFSFKTDTKYGHLWESCDGNSPATCKCGKYSSSCIDSADWLFLDKSESLLPSARQEITFSGSDNDEGFPVLLDELSVKINASSVAFETASSILQIGLCIVSDG